MNDQDCLLNHKSAQGASLKALLGILLVALLLFSCSHAPPSPKGGAADVQKKGPKTDISQKSEDTEPKPGDVRVIDGVEYIYARNKRYMSSPGEPEYVWMRKDQYSPGLLETVRSAPAGPTKEQKEMEQRIAKLEEELKKRDASRQTVAPAQPIPLPLAQPVSTPPVRAAIVAASQAPATTYPSPKLKRRVLVLPLAHAADARFGQIAELTTSRLVAKLEKTGMLICLDPGTVRYRSDVDQAIAMKDLDEVYGIQAVIKGTLSAAQNSADPPMIQLMLYNAETGIVIRQLSGTGALLTRQQEARPETERLATMDRALEPIAEDVVRSLLSLDWHARIASTEQGRVFINAGRLSGLEKGDTLDVYTPGEQVIDAATKMPLGKLKGSYKGEIEVAELFGVDASWAKPKRGDSLSPADLVYMKK